MNKILITHHGYNGTTGWAKIGQSIILALDEAGFDVVPRAIILNEKASIDNRILELEKKSDKDCDTILNVVLPHHLEYNSNFKNIALFFHETNFIPLEWSSKLNLMDEIWVVNTSMIEACRNSGITKPVHLVQPPVDTSKYERTYQPVKSLKDKLAGEFSFLWVGDLNRRKNLAGFLKAFHTEFHPSEPVSLVIKPYKFNTSYQEVESIVRKMSEEVRHGLKLYPNLNDYKPEIVMPEHTSDEEMMGLHSTCDCFVSCPFGEAWGNSIIDSMGLGKLTIAHKVGGPRDYCIGYNECDEQENWWEDFANSLTVDRYESTDEIAFGMSEGFPWLFTSKEVWKSPSTCAIMDRMRIAYRMNNTDKEILGKNAIKTVYGLSYECFAKRVGDILNV